MHDTKISGAPHLLSGWNSMRCIYGTRTAMVRLPCLVKERTEIERRDRRPLAQFELAHTILAPPLPALAAIKHEMNSVEITGVSEMQLCLINLSSASRTMCQYHVSLLRLDSMVHVGKCRCSNIAQYLVPWQSSIISSPQSRMTQMRHDTNTAVER